MWRRSDKLCFGNFFVSRTVFVSVIPEPKLGIKWMHAKSADL